MNGQFYGSLDRCGRELSSSSLRFGSVKAFKEFGAGSCEMSGR